MIVFRMQSYYNFSLNVHARIKIFEAIKIHLFEHVYYTHYECQTTKDLRR